MAKQFQFDLICAPRLPRTRADSPAARGSGIGGGSGGVRASRIAAGHGARVALIETAMRHGPPNYTAIGGTCVNVGCVPKKLMVYASHFHEDFANSEGFGWVKPETTPKHNWTKLMENKNKEISRLNGAYSKILANAGKSGVTVIEGKGSLVNPHTVRYVDANGKATDLTTEKIVLAVGGWPYKPSEVVGIEHAITSNEAFYLPERPARVLVVGGGYIAVEFACIFNGLGSRVTQMYRGPLFLRGFDDDVRSFLLAEMKKKHIDVHLEEDPTKIEKLPDGSLRVTTIKGFVGEYDCVMYATGRRPLVDGLGLEKLGIKTGKVGEVLVNEWSETSCPGVYAVGDCTDRINLTPVALREGHLLADALFGTRKRAVDYNLVPSAVFSQPEIATVGLTEAEAAAKYKNVTVYTNTYKAMKHTMSGSDEKAFMKLIVDDASDRVVGLHIVGDAAGEICQGFAVAMRAGATKADFDDTIGIHPTAAEELCTMRTPAYKIVNGTKL